jgi:L-lactate dehydrogenase complex protein LldE
MPAVSAAIMNEKLDRVEASGADTLVGGDISCLTHLAGGLRRRGSKIEVKHIAELLASGDK